MKNFKILISIISVISSSVIFSEVLINPVIFKIAPILGKFFAQQSNNPDVITFNEINELYMTLKNQPLKASAEDQQYLVGFIQAVVDRQKTVQSQNKIEVITLGMENTLGDYLSAQDLIFIQKDLIGMLFATNKINFDLSDIQIMLRDDGSYEAKRVLTGISRMSVHAQDKLVKYVNEVLSYLQQKAHQDEILFDVAGMYEGSLDQTAKEKAMHDYDAIIETVHNLFDNSYEEYAKQEQSKIIAQIQNLAKVLNALRQVVAFDKAEELYRATEQVEKLIDVLKAIDGVKQDSRRSAGVRFGGSRAGIRPSNPLMDL